MNYKFWGFGCIVINKYAPRIVDTKTQDIYFSVSIAKMNS